MWHRAGRIARKFRDIRSRHGLRVALTWVVECSLQRLGYDRTIVLRLDLHEPCHLLPPPHGFRAKLLTADEVRSFATHAEYELPAPMATRIDQGLDLCTAVLQGPKLIAYAWYALDSIEPEHNGGLALSFAADCAYVYKGFTLPEFRGQGLISSRAKLAHEIISGMGIRYLVATVISTNPAAIRNAEKSGYRRCGTFYTLELGRTCVRYSTVPLRRLGLSIGKAADLTRRQQSFRRAGPTAHAVPPRTA
jgi:GNAT superfamily N-acetyltransferase